MIFIYLLSGLFLGWSLGANDTGNIFGAAVETRMLKFRTAALIAAVFITLGAVIEGSGPSQTLGRLGSVDALGGAFTVALAAAAAITVMVRIRIPVSTSQTIVGAIIGWNFFSGRLTDFNSLLTIASSWVTAFVLSGVISALLFMLFRYYLSRGKIHLLEQDLYTRYALVVVGAFGAYSLGANNIANVVGVFVPVSPFKDFTLAKLFVFDGITQLYFLGAMAIVAGIYTYSHKVMRTVGKDLFHLSPITALIAVMAEAIVLFLFASRGLYNLLLRLGLPTIPLVPVSSSQVIVGAIVGIGLVKGGKNLKYNILGRISLAWFIAPLMAFLFSFVALFIIQNVFEQEVHQNIRHVFNRTTVSRIGSEGYDTKALSMVNGRSFASERELYHELRSTGANNREQILELSRITEEFPLEVNMEILEKKGLADKIHKLQYLELSQLEGTKYRHKWQFAEALGAFPAWQRVEAPHTEAQKNHNRLLESKLDLLYRTFYKAGK